MTRYLISTFACFAFIGFVAVVHAESASDHYAGLNEPHGVVIGDVSRLSQDIYEVQTIEINDQLIPGSREVLFLKPGEYKLKFRIIADNLQRPILGSTRGPRPKDYNAITLNIEPGKEYYVGAKLNPYADGYPWSIVLWKVEEKD